MRFAYLGYLTSQVRQSFAKRHKPPREVFIDFVLASTALPYTAKILCLGPRNQAELDCWRVRGYHHVEGIDLLPARGMRLGDMHRLPYAENSQDVVYASHVLEHAFHPAQVAQEIVRVLKLRGLFFAAFPVGFTPNHHDRFDYRHADGLLTWFRPARFTSLWTQERPTEVALLARLEVKG